MRAAEMAELAMELFSSRAALILVSLVPTVLACVLGVWILLRKAVISSSSTNGRRPVAPPLPPGPRGLPIIGHLHLLGELPHRSLFELSKVYGPLMLLRLGSVPTVVASSPAMARLILRDHDHAFTDRLPTAAGTHIFGGPRGMVFSSSASAHWRLLRRLSATELFSAKRLHFFKSVRAQEARSLMRSLLDDCLHVGGLCCPRPKLQQAMNNIVTKKMTGKTLTELAGDDATRIVELIVQVPKLVGMFNVGDYLPFLAWMDLQGCGRQSKQVAIGLREAFERIVEARRHNDKQTSDHYLDVLLEYASSSSTTPIPIMESFLELFVGGTDTSAATIEWALAELLTNQEKMHLVQQEIDQVVGRARVVEEADIAHLPYLVACVKETMRLHPVVPLLVPHTTNQNIHIANFLIPANTQAYVNVWAIGRDSSTWEKPFQFLPERFLATNSADLQGQHFELLPFGSGRRICPGLRLALPSVNLILACILQGFEWTLSPSQSVDMAEEFGVVTSMKTLLTASITPRLAKDLYS